MIRLIGLSPYPLFFPVSIFHHNDLMAGIFFCGFWMHCYTYDFLNLLQSQYKLMCEKNNEIFA
jgi:hypothetical protein